MHGDCRVPQATVVGKAPALEEIRIAKRIQSSAKGWVCLFLPSGCSTYRSALQVPRPIVPLLTRRLRKGT